MLSFACNLPWGAVTELTWACLILTIRPPNRWAKQTSFCLYINPASGILLQQQKTKPVEILKASDARPERHWDYILDTRNGLCFKLSVTTCLEHTKKNSLCLSFQIEWGLRKAFPHPLSPYPTEKSVPPMRVWYGDRESEGENGGRERSGGGKGVEGGRGVEGEADLEMLTLGWAPLRDKFNSLLFFPGPSTGDCTPALCKI